MENTEYVGDAAGLVSNPKSLFAGEKMLSQCSVDKKKDYKCFSVFFLYKDLFYGDDENAPLIIIEEIPKSHKDALEFILPPEMIKIIDGSGKITTSGSNNNYAGFFQYSVNDNKVRDILFDILHEMGSKAFVETVRSHISEKLNSAVFPDYSELKRYLNKIGNEIIVPYSEAPRANKKFNELLADKVDSESMPLIVANFFVSCLIGLRSMNYEKTGNKYPSKKTYLLSEYGMETIWTPEMITPPRDAFDEVQQMFKFGGYSSAVKIGKKWLNEYGKVASKEELAIAYRILGCSICSLTAAGGNEFGYGYSEGIEYLVKCTETGKADSSVFYTLYDYLKDSSADSAYGYLKTAFELNDANAVKKVAFSFLNNESIIDDVSKDILVEKINGVIKDEQKNSTVDVSECLYLRGRFWQKDGNSSKADSDFGAAAKRGNEKAKQEISRRRRNERLSFPYFISDPCAPCCFANSFSGHNNSVISSFPSSKWAMYTSGEVNKKDVDNVSSVDIEEFIDMQKKTGFGHSRLVFLLMSENEEKNLNECLVLLDKLFNIVLDKPENDKWRIIDSIDIYVSAQFETAAMLIDANLSDMGNEIYFKVHIMDANRDTVHKLLCDVPLFLPAIKKEKSINAVLFGGSEMNYCFIKESIACAYLGDNPPVKITLFGDNADSVENTFRQECPGIYNNPGISCIRPEFFKCSIKETDFPSLIYGSVHKQALNDEDNDKGSFEKKAAGALLNANYFIVDISADDLENIKFAAELRTWLLRSRGTFDRAPFIAVRCSGKQNSYLAGHLTLSGQAAGNSYYNMYDLFPMGNSSQIYSYANIIEKPVLSDFALRIHKSYYGDNERRAENDFYTYSYNADSSLTTAIGLSYRFFAAGVAFKDRGKYMDFGFYNSPEIVAEFEKKYKAKLDDLGALEQSRWNGFMLTRGWEPADSNQVQAYEKQSTGFAHKHALAKIHPFIREWNDLSDPDLERCLGILKSRFNYERKPQVTTMKGIEDTAKLFRTIEKIEERTR